MKILKNKWIKFGLLPIILFFVWLLPTISYIQKSSGFNVLLYPYNRKNFTILKEGELLKKDKLKAEFNSQADKLGIVAVKFHTFIRINNDRLIFRLKEKGQKNWFYENKYLSNQFQSDDFFTFGFPPIEDSEGKTYQFELESIKGARDDAVSLSKIEPVFASKHQYPKSVLSSNNEVLKYFLVKKVSNLLSDVDFLISSLTYLLPLVFYLSYILFFKKHITRKNIQKYKNEARSIGKNIPGKNKVILLPAIFILLDAFFVRNVSHFSILIIIAIWIAIIIVFEFNNRISFVAALIFLGLCPILMIINLGYFAQKLALWAYMFLLVGTIHQILDMKKVFRKK